MTPRSRSGAVRSGGGNSFERTKFVASNMRRNGIRFDGFDCTTHLSNPALCETGGELPFWHERGLKDGNVKLTHHSGKIALTRKKLGCLSAPESF